MPTACWLWLPTKEAREALDTTCASLHAWISQARLRQSWAAWRLTAGGTLHLIVGVISVARTAGAALRVVISRYGCKRRCRCAFAGALRATSACAPWPQLCSGRRCQYRSYRAFVCRSANLGGLICIWDAREECKVCMPVGLSSLGVPLAVLARCNMSMLLMPFGAGSGGADAALAGGRRFVCVLPRRAPKARASFCRRALCSASRRLQLL